ncbi:3-hydroxyacyl-CoA dehydrogenase family protein [bacterium]|nr:3-hydroxyacyl-CoA dehydrogenase family protein [bacterium]
MGSNIKNVTVFGAGLMGNGIAQVAAQNGYRVTLVDVDKAFLEKGIARLEGSLKRVLRKKVEGEEAQQIAFNEVMARISTSTDAEGAVANADLVVEAIIENLEIKQDLFASLDKAAPAPCLFASNTSSLPIKELAAATNRADRFGGLHFFNPVPVMRLVEVVKAEETSEETHTALLAFGEGVGKRAVTCKDTPGFIVNRLLVPYLMEAVRLLDRGDASEADIDDAMKMGCGYPMGPLQLLDYVGLDTTKFIMDGWHNAFPDQALFDPSPLLDKLVSEGKLGRKSGEGFYSYTKK